MVWVGLPLWTRSRLSFCVSICLNYCTHHTASSSLLYCLVSLLEDGFLYSRDHVSFIVVSIHSALDRAWRGCVCPLAREERSGLSGSSQAPPAGRSGAAQGLTARGPQESATEAKNTQRDRRLKSRERDHDFLPGLLFSPPSSLFPPSPHPSRVEVSLRPTGRSSSESSFPRSLPLASLTPTPRQARRSRRRGRWRRPPVPAGPRGRFEEPERPTEASREDAAAEDEPAERAVSPAGRSPES